MTFAVASYKAFKWAGDENANSMEKDTLLIVALACALQSVWFIKLWVGSVDFENFAIHSQNLRKIAKAEKRFKIYKRAFQIKKERYEKN